MKIISLLFFVWSASNCFFEPQTKIHGLDLAPSSDSVSIYKLWELDTLLGKEATIFGGIQIFQVLDMRDSTELKMHAFNGDAHAIRYMIIGNEIVLVNKKGIPYKSLKQKKQSGTYILYIKHLSDTQLIVSVNGDVVDSENNRSMEFFQVVYLAKSR
jgi:hypothetical protein